MLRRSFLLGGGAAIFAATLTTPEDALAWGSRRSSRRRSSSSGMSRLFGSTNRSRPKKAKAKKRRDPFDDLFENEEGEDCDLGDLLEGDEDCK